MARLIAEPVVVEAVGNLPKKIEEFVGRVATGTSAVSVARMTSPAGWEGPDQRPEFDEILLVLAGRLRLETRRETLEAGASQVLIAPAGEWARFSTPEASVYLAICLPAFSPATVHREE